MPVPPNTALLTDAFHSALGASRGAAKRERWASPDCAPRLPSGARWSRTSRLRIVARAGPVRRLAFAARGRARTASSVVPRIVPEPIPR
jgi:hypothetical protein